MNLRELAFGDVEEGLGDVFCTQDEWAAAAAAMGALHQTMQKAPQAVRDKYAGPVNGVLLTWNQLEAKRNDSVLARISPTFYCAYKPIARDANQLAARVAADSTAAGKPQASPVNNPLLNPGPTSSSIGTIVALALAAAVAAIVVPPLLSARAVTR